MVVQHFFIIHNIIILYYSHDVNHDLEIMLFFCLVINMYCCEYCMLSGSPTLIHVHPLCACAISTHASSCGARAAAFNFYYQIMTASCTYDFAMSSFVVKVNPSNPHCHVIVGCHLFCISRRIQLRWASKLSNDG